MSVCMYVCMYVRAAPSKLPNRSLQLGCRWIGLGLKIIPCFGPLLVGPPWSPLGGKNVPRVDTNFLITEPIETEFGRHIQDPKRSRSCNRVPHRGTPWSPLGVPDPPAPIPIAQPKLLNRSPQMRCHWKGSDLTMFSCHRVPPRRTPLVPPGGRKPSPRYKLPYY
jgi:hypothetical protein